MEPKPLKYKKLAGLSEEQLSQHHDVLYVGYVNKVKQIAEAVPKAKLEGTNATFSELRELKVEETFALNGVKLHEAYFDNMGGAGGPPEGKIKDLIERDFGSVEGWVEQFKACGMAARGWVVLAYDLESQQLRNIVCDAHNQGGIWNAVTMLVLDVYEHAYFIDYGTARAKYIEAFMNTVDWKAVNERFELFGIQE